MDEIDTNSKINQEYISLNINSNNIEEKSTFERAIIEAFKQKNAYDCIKKLSIAYDEIKFFIKEIKASKGKKFILNKNVLDKLNRLIGRKYFNVNILIGKIYNELLEASNFEILSNDINLLLQLSNQVINNLDIIQSINISLDLEKKCATFLNYLIENTEQNLDDEQKESLQELFNSFPSRYSSESFNNFKNIKEEIIQCCESDDFENKMKGIFLLMDNFGNTYSIEEQFDLLLLYGNEITKSILSDSDIKYRKVYFQLGNFMNSMLYNIKFKVIIEDENQNNNSNSKLIFLYDNVKEDEKEIENIHLEKSETDYSMSDLSFLKDSLFELTTKKDILVKSENIISICLLILNSLIIYDNLFDLQYVCYLLLKKIYFRFPQYRQNIEDLLIKNLINLNNFNSPEERKIIMECLQFLHYILKEGDENLKNKLKTIIEEKKININLEVNLPFDRISVEYEKLVFSDFNLRFGFPYLCNIDAGGEFAKYFEIENPNSLIYIGIAINAYDINIKLLKYCPNVKIEDNNYDELTDNDHFIEVFKLDRFDCSEIPLKIILFTKEPGIYKLVFDNGFSWFTSKIVRYRLNVLKLLSDIKQDKNENHEKNKETDKIDVHVQI